MNRELICDVVNALFARLEDLLHAGLIGVGIWLFFANLAEHGPWVSGGLALFFAWVLPAIFLPPFGSSDP